METDTGVGCTICAVGAVFGVFVGCFGVFVGGLCVGSGNDVPVGIGVDGTDVGRITGVETDVAGGIVGSNTGNGVDVAPSVAAVDVPTGSDVAVRCTLGRSPSTSMVTVSVGIAGMTVTVINGVVIDTVTTGIPVAVGNSTGIPVTTGISVRIVPSRTGVTVVIGTFRNPDNDGVDVGVSVNETTVTASGVAVGDRVGSTNDGSNAASLGMGVDGCTINPGNSDSAPVPTDRPMSSIVRPIGSLKVTMTHNVTITPARPENPVITAGLFPTYRLIVFHIHHAAFTEIRHNPIHSGQCSAMDSST